ncbi:DUF5777 family beta-barrel protein [Flagellimonas sp. HMM57]|uniref:DUF5777 family beta-barrel protein n=1 Tax=unclassified Flagellimonas TaxID=2644544 RepID=UPI0013D0BE81|nr:MULTISPECIES: DUF5777 family beta-barrel protein [unclassified Flagellimonas]UII77312.1 DUF5777 family beta-barrel protein [Flagellimonas sp. HMM57]
MKIIYLIIFFIPIVVFSQDDLLSEIDTNDTKDFESAAFKGLKIINFESTKMVSQKELYFVVSHRFGSIKPGFEDFFGLDQAVTRLNFIYGVSDGINIGVSRSSFLKTYESSLKLRLVRQQKKGFPVTLVGFGTLLINGALDDANLPLLQFENRLGYTAQLLIAKKFNKNFSLELIPTFFHDNLVQLDEQENSQYALGIGGRHKLSKRLSLNIDYGFHLNRAENAPFNNPLSVGIDIETGGHVFQLHFTNAQPMNTNGFLGQATGDWSDGDIFFGFNLSRVF